MLPMLVTGWQASAVRGNEALPPSSWCVHRCCGQSAFRDRHVNSRQPSGMDKLNLNNFFFKTIVVTLRLVH